MNKEVYSVVYNLSELLELKARVKSLDAVRKRLLSFNAVYVGTCRQVDTYFNSSKGRLKLREVDSQEGAKLIHYCREGIPGPKRSESLIVELQEPDSIKELFVRLFGKKAVVDKKREIYTFEGTQIHLDIVQGLGTFIEFERRVADVSLDRRVLEELMGKLFIREQDLIQGSYCDLKVQQENG